MRAQEKYLDLEHRLLILQDKCAHKSVSLGEILYILSGKGQPLILLLLSLPFCQPIQIPGLSAPFGLCIAFIGLRMAFGKHLWLPRRILDMSIMANTLRTIIDKTIWLVRKMKGWVRPRLTWLCVHPVIHKGHGIIIFLLGLLLALPLPIPFSNLTSAWSIFFIGLGILEDDGLFVLIGYLFAVVTVIFFTVIILSIKSILLTGRIF